MDGANENLWNPFDGTLCVGFKTSAWGNAKQLSTAAIETDADRRRLRLTAKLVESKEFAACLATMGRVRAWIRAVAVPFEAVGDGHYLIRTNRKEELEERYRKLVEDELPPLTREVIATWDQRVSEAKAALASLGNGVKFPSGEVVAAKFSAQMWFVNFNPAGAMKGMLEEIERDARTA